MPRVDDVAVVPSAVMPLHARAQRVDDLFQRGGGFVGVLPHARRLARDADVRVGKCLCVTVCVAGVERREELMR